MAASGKPAGFRDRSFPALVQAVAHSSRHLWYAVIGADVPLLLAACEGLRMAVADANSLARVSGGSWWKPSHFRWRVWCFHWESDKGLRDVRQELDTLEPGRRVPARDIVRWVVAGDGRLDWVRTIERVERADTQPAEALGLVLHTGVGRNLEIRGDLAVLLPLMGDQTVLGLPGMARQQVRQTFEQLCRWRGWSGVEIGDLGLLYRPPWPTGGKAMTGRR